MADPSMAQGQDGLSAHCRLAVLGNAGVRPEQPERLQTDKPPAPRPGAQAQVAWDVLRPSTQAPRTRRQHVAPATPGQRVPTYPMPLARERLPKGHAGAEKCTVRSRTLRCAKTARRAGRALQSPCPAWGGLQQPNGPWGHLLTFQGTARRDRQHVASTVTHRRRSLWSSPSSHAARYHPQEAAGPPRCERGRRPACLPHT